MLFAIDVVVTLIFDADVEAQSGAYATGVLVLILSAAFAATLALWREGRSMLWRVYWASSAWCSPTRLSTTVIERPDGLIIGGFFTVDPDAGERFEPFPSLDRAARPTRLLRDVESWRLGRSYGARRCISFPIQVRDSGGAPQEEARKSRQALQRARHASCSCTSTCSIIAANSPRRWRSSCIKEGEDYVAEVYGAIAIANTIAFVSEAHRPHLDLHRAHPPGPDGAGDPLPAVRRRRDGADGLHDSAAVLGLDTRRKTCGRSSS